MTLARPDRPARSLFTCFSPPDQLLQSDADPASSSLSSQAVHSLPVHCYAMPKADTHSLLVANEAAGLRETATTRAMNNVDILVMIIEKLDYPSYNPSWALNEVKKTWDSEVLPRRVSKLWKTLWDRRFASAYGTPDGRRNRVLHLTWHGPLLRILATMPGLAYTKVSATIDRVRGHEPSFWKIMVICAATLTDIGLTGTALVALAEISGSDPAVVFPQIRSLDLELSDLNDLAWNGGRTCAKHVKAAIMASRMFSEATALKVQLSARTSGATRPRARVLWQQREVVLSILSGAIDSLTLRIEVGGDSQMETSDLEEILNHFDVVTSLDLSMYFFQGCLPARRWPSSIQKLQINRAGHNMPQLLHILSQPRILPNLRFVPKVTGGCDSDSGSLDDVVSRWMVDQAVIGLRQRGTIENLNVEKLPLYDLVNEGRGGPVNMPYIDDGWATMRRYD